MSKALVIGLELCSTAITLAMGIIWCLIGAAHVTEDKCIVESDDSPNIASWLIVDGAVLLGMACISLLLLPIRLSKNAAHAAKLWSCLNFLFGLWNIAWLIIGAVRLSDTTCDDGSTIYKTTLAAIILGFVLGLPLICVSSGTGLRGNNDN